MGALVLLSGEIGSGKTTAGLLAAATSGAQWVSVRATIAQILKIPADNRALMQLRAGELETRTHGQWLARALVVSDKGAIVDSVRTIAQVNGVREKISSAKLVFLDASEETRQHRYAASADAMKRATRFEIAANHATELGVISLRELADEIVETDLLRPEEVAERIVLLLDPQ